MTDFKQLPALCRVTATLRPSTDSDIKIEVCHPEKLVDFAYRAVHEMTVAAKAIVHAFYDARPKLRR